MIDDQSLSVMGADGGTGDVLEGHSRVAKSKGKALKLMHKLSQDTHGDLQLLDVIEYYGIIRQRAISMVDIELIEHGNPNP